MAQEVEVSGGIGLGVRIFLGFLLGAVLCGMCLLFSCLGLGFVGGAVGVYEQAKTSVEAGK